MTKYRLDVMSKEFHKLDTENVLALCSKASTPVKKEDT